MKQALLHAYSRYELKNNDWSHWLNLSLDNEFASMTWTEQALLHACSRHESIVSLLQWHQISRRNKLETSDEMSLKHSNKMITKWTRKKEVD